MTSLLAELWAKQPWPQRSKAGEFEDGKAASRVRLLARRNEVVIIPAWPNGMILPPRMKTGGLSVKAACAQEAGSSCTFPLEASRDSARLLRKNGNALLRHAAGDGFRFLHQVSQRACLC